MTTPGDEDVRRLDVAMDDALAVRRVESIGDFDSQRKQLFGFHRPSGDLVSEGCSVEELHHHKGAALTFSDVAVMRPTLITTRIYRCRQRRKVVRKATSIVAIADLRS